jgi:16S rRNA (adenine1518-N6/adenine1519-N6)-dimethyltransferase
MHIAKKRFGQHFLKDKHIAERIVGALEDQKVCNSSRVANFENVLEVGPGLGVLTQYLYPVYGEKLYLVEIDKDLVPGLKSNYPLIQDHIIEQDFLEVDIAALFQEPVAIIGNFPYNISTQILFKVVENRNIVPVMVGMFQKEVAQRVAAQPGNKIYGLLSAWVQSFYEIEYLFTVNEGSFSPPPKVKSAVIRLNRKAEEPDCDHHLLLQVIKAAFNQRRKTLRNALHAYSDRFANIPDPDILTKRAEQLHYTDFAMLARAVER